MPGACSPASLAHGAPHITRAVLEAGGFALRHVAEPIQAAGVRIGRLVVSGASGSLSRIASMRADILGVPVEVPPIPDTAAAGAAILAAVGAGVHGDARAAIRAMVRMAQRAEPDPAAHARYEELYRVYRELHPATVALQHRLADLAETSSTGA
ncbi:MAG: FGGY-family carbohydrate kinase [Chloroflexota bacterium]